MRTLLLALLVVYAAAAPQQLVKKAKPVKLLNGAIEWPFYTTDDDVYLNLTIGTPAQQVSVSVYMYGIDDLRIASATNGGEGDYNEAKSSTYTALGVAKNDRDKTIGTKAEENFKFGGNTFKEIPFVLQYLPYPYKNYIGFGPISDDFTFLRNLVNPAVDKTTVIAFDNYPKSGAITLAGLDKKRCYKDWQLMDEAFWEAEQDPDHANGWGVEIDKVSVGKWAAASPGFLSFSVYDEPFLWPRDAYTAIITQLGSVDGKTIPCDTTTPITFTVEGVTLNLTPDLYLDTEREDIDGSCYLSGATTAKGEEFRIPQIFFSKYCLSFNHYTNKVGFATRRIN